MKKQYGVNWKEYQANKKLDDFILEQLDDEKKEDEDD